MVTGCPVRPEFNDAVRSAGIKRFKLRDDRGLTRDLTDKELHSLRDSKLAGRIRYQLRRRADDTGSVDGRRLREALAVKKKRFADAEFLNTAPVGPGCNWLSVGPRNISPP